MRTLVYVDESIVADAPAFIKPFQEKETEQQFTWEQVAYLMSTEGVIIRPPTLEETESAKLHLNLIKACTAYLSQFMEQAEA